MNNEETEVVEAPKRAVAITNFNQLGLVDFKDNEDLANAAKFLIQIKMAPEGLWKKKNPKDQYDINLPAVMSAMVFCKQNNLPYSAMGELCYIHGKIGAFGSLVTALAQKDPNYGEMSVAYVNKEMEHISLENKNLSHDVYACVIRIRKKNSEVWNEYYFTLDEAKKAGLLSNSTYQKYLKDMLYHRAKFRAMQTEYAGALKGVYSAEILIQEEESRSVSPAEELNKKLGIFENNEVEVVNE